MLAKFIAELVARLRGGTKTLNSVEMALIDAVVPLLPKNEADILAIQVRSIDLVQRLDPRRMTICFFSEKSSVPTLPYPGDAHCLAEIEYSEKNGERRRRVQIVLHDGRFNTIEGHIPASMPEAIPTSGIALHPSKKVRAAGAIDRLEHGSENERD